MATILNTLIDVNSKLKAGVPIQTWKKELDNAITLLENGRSLEDDIHLVDVKKCYDAKCKPETSKSKSKKSK